MFERARVSAVVMTNDPFDPAKHRLWQKGRPADTRFKAALRIDPLLNEWATARRGLAAAGYSVGAEVDVERDGRRRSALRRRLDRAHGSVLSRGVAARRFRVARRQPARTADRACGASGMPRSPPAVRDDDRRAPRGESGAAGCRRRRGTRRRVGDSSVCAGCIPTTGFS